MPIIQVRLPKRLEPTKPSQVAVRSIGHQSFRKSQGRLLLWRLRELSKRLSSFWRDYRICQARPVAGLLFFEEKLRLAEFVPLTKQPISLIADSC
jgi:hypothetical protein